MEILAILIGMIIAAGGVLVWTINNYINRLFKSI